MENMSVKVLFRKFKSGYFAGDIIAFLIDAGQNRR